MRTKKRREFYNSLAHGFIFGKVEGGESKGKEGKGRERKGNEVKGKGRVEFAHS